MYKTKPAILICSLLTMMIWTTDASSNELTQSRFAWGDAKALVTETRTKNENTLLLEYVIELTRNDSGYVLQQSDVRYKEINGIAVNNSDLPPELLMSVSFPPILIDNEGYESGVVDFEGFFRQLLPDADEDKIVNFLNNENMQDLIIGQFTQTWGAWVSTWIESPPADGLPIEQKEEVPMFGALMPRTTIQTNHGPIDDTGRVKHSFNTFIRGKEASEALVQVVKRLSESGGKPVNEEDYRLMTVDIASETTAIIEPSTLKPHLVTVFKSNDVQAPDGHKKTTETRRYEFQWID